MRLQFADIYCYFIKSLSSKSQSKGNSANSLLRAAIVPIFGSLEIGAIPPRLLDILKTSGDQWVRKNACEALIQIGPVATVYLLEALGQQHPKRDIGI